MSTRAPSPYQVEQAMSVLMAARERLLTDEPGIEADEKLYLDCLDATSDDAFEVIDRIVAAAIEADDLAEQASRRMADIAERRARFKRRNEQLRGVAFAMLEALDIAKFERADYTASIRAGQPRVVVTDETMLPPQFLRLKTETDKAAIGAALKGGGTVPGAELSNSMPSLSIRTR